MFGFKQNFVLVGQILVLVEVTSWRPLDGTTTMTIGTDYPVWVVDLHT